MSFLLEGGVTFAYGRTGQVAQVVLRDLNFTLPAGRTVVVLGLSGLGKTTLLNLLGLLWDRGLQGGRISYTPPGDKPVEYANLTAPARARLRASTFGLVPQVAHFLSGFTCQQNLRLPLLMRGATTRQADERIRQLLAQAAQGPAGGDLTSLLSRYPDQASTGQRQRLSVVRAVLHDPPVLLADEPVSNLDVVNKRLLLDFLCRWRNNRLHDQQERARTLILVCHEVETAWQVAERPDDLLLFLRPPAPDEEPGARAELLSRSAFCESHRIDPVSEQARVAGPQAIRAHVEQTVPVVPG